MKIIPSILLGMFLAPCCWAASFDLPKGWKVEAPASKVIEFNAFHGNDASIIVAKRAKDGVPGDSLAEVLEFFVADHRANPTFAKETKTKKVKAGALKGMTITYEVTSPDPKGVKIAMRFHFTVFPHKENYLIVMASARTPLFPKLGFDTIVPTFKP